MSPKQWSDGAPMKWGPMSEGSYEMGSDGAAGRALGGRQVPMGRPYLIGPRYPKLINLSVRLENLPGRQARPLTAATVPSSSRRLVPLPL